VVLVPEELAQRDVHLAVIHHAVERAQDESRDPPPDQEDHDREQDLDPDREQVDVGPVDDVVERERHPRSQGGGLSAFAR
jgi:hypothetical protein